MPRIVLHHSARYTNSATLDAADLRTRVERLLECDEQLREEKEPIFRDPDLIYCEFATGVQLWELLYNEQNCPIPRDIQLLLAQKIDQSPPAEEVVVAAATPVGSLGLYDTGLENEINDKDGWRNLVRAERNLVRVELSAEPGDAAEFVSKCAKAFPKLHFSTEFPVCLDGLQGGHQAYSVSIVECFTALNDDLMDCLGTLALPDGLKQFAAKSKYDTTLEGNGKRKPALTFKFAFDGGEISVLCEPHMKIRSPDSDGDSSRQNARIYFSPRPHPSKPDRVLVGHAGAHL